MDRFEDDHEKFEKIKRKDGLMSVGSTVSARRGRRLDRNGGPKKSDVPMGIKRRRHKKYFDGRDRGCLV